MQNLQGILMFHVKPSRALLQGRLSRHLVPTQILALIRYLRLRWLPQMIGGDLADMDTRAIIQVTQTLKQRA